MRSGEQRVRGEADAPRRVFQALAGTTNGPWFCRVRTARRGGRPDPALLAVLACTGCRVGKLAGLQRGSYKESRPAEPVTCLLPALPDRTPGALSGPPAASRSLTDVLGPEVRIRAVGLHLANQGAHDLEQRGV